MTEDSSTLVFRALDNRTKEIFELLETESPKINEQLAVLIASSVRSTDAVIDTCDQGHKFSKLPDHPLRMGRPICVHCAVIGLKAVMIELGEKNNDSIMLRAAAEYPDLESANGS